MRPPPYINPFDSQIIFHFSHCLRTNIVCDPTLSSLHKMTDSGKIKLRLEGDVPPPLTKRGKPKKVKTPGMPTSMKRTMAKEPREKISNVRREILILLMVPYSEHDKY